MKEKDVLNNEEMNLENQEEINMDVQEENIKDEIQKHLDELKNQNDQLNDKYLRLCAEFDNYKKRTNKEKLNLIDTANMQLIIDLLPIIDDIERGLEAIEKNSNFRCDFAGI